MKRYSYLFILILIFILLISCGCTVSNQHSDDNTPTAVHNTSDYFPAAPGSSWSYLGEGIEYASFTRTAVYYSGNLAQFTSCNGGTVTTTIFEIADDYIKSIYVENESYQPGNLLEKGFIPNDDTILLMVPLDAGTSWQNKNDSREILSAVSSVDTAMGSFDNCIKIQITTEYSTMYEYYHKDVGLIKSEFVSEGLHVTSTLEEFKINED